MTSPNAMVTDCPCCGRCFETLSDLLVHMKLKHTEQEILLCTRNEKSPLSKITTVVEAWAEAVYHPEDSAPTL